ncbi:acetyltransferase domain-containing protein [Xylaria arbuscula]|nr:acetyltransferase domain-containing protein [Xylaria arbuscula]
MRSALRIFLSLKKTMRANKDLAISTDKVLLVPYDAHHVGRYHEWMQDEDLCEATASDLLTLEEEYENQQSWRTAHDKLTFIICQSATTSRSPPASSSPDANLSASSVPVATYAGEDDAEVRMVGDVNLFLTPDDDDDDINNGGEKETAGSRIHLVKGEIDIMIAAPEHRRKGLGEAAVRAFLAFLRRHHGDILDEYVCGTEGGSSTSTGTDAADTYRVSKLVAKINAENMGSIRLFENLGFRRHGEPNYFNEVSMVLVDFLGTGAGIENHGLGYRESFYDRSRLKK